MNVYLKLISLGKASSSIFWKKKKNIKIMNFFFYLLSIIEDGHLLKALLPIYFTEAGIIIWLNEMHSEKHLSPIEVTDEGIEISFKDEHLSKAKLSIEVTEFEIEICSNEEHSEKAAK